MVSVCVDGGYILALRVCFCVSGVGMVISSLKVIKGHLPGEGQGLDTMMTHVTAFSFSLLL